MSSTYQVSKLVMGQWIEVTQIVAKGRRAAKSKMEGFSEKQITCGGVWKLRLLK